MKRRAVLLALVLCAFLAAGGAAQGERVVYRADEALSLMMENTDTLDLYVAPLQGADCMLVTANGHAMLVDMGRERDFETIKAWLKGLGVDHIDIAFNTHPHDDHIGSMKALLNEFTVGTFMTAFPDDFTGVHVIQPSVLKAVREKGITVQRINNGDTFSLGKAKCTVIRMTKHNELNPLSAMLKIEYGERSVLLTADVIGWAQKRLAENNDLKADIFKFPHHGLTPVMVEFLEAIDPEYTFFTHGYANTKRSQKQMDKYGISYDFATWGAIHLSTDGLYWSVSQELTEEGKAYTEKYR